MFGPTLAARQVRKARQDQAQEDRRAVVQGGDNNNLHHTLKRSLVYGMEIP